MSVVVKEYTFVLGVASEGEAQPLDVVDGGVQLRFVSRARL